MLSALWALMVSIKGVDDMVSIKGVDDMVPKRDREGSVFGYILYVFFQSWS
jgi:hypothetical protein